MAVFLCLKVVKSKKLSTIRQNRSNPFAVRAFRSFSVPFFLSPFPLAFGLFLRGQKTPKKQSKKQQKKKKKSPEKQKIRTADRTDQKEPKTPPPLPHESFPPLPHESFRVVKGNNKKNKFVDLLL